MAVEDPLSKYDDITSEDLFDSFMNVAITVEKEINGDVIKSDVITDTTVTETYLNGHASDDGDKKLNTNHENGYSSDDISNHGDNSETSTRLQHTPELNVKNDITEAVNHSNDTPVFTDIKHNIVVENNEEDNYCVPGSIISSEGVTQRPHEYTPSDNDTSKDLYAIPKKDYPLITSDYNGIVENGGVKNEENFNEVQHYNEQNEIFNPTSFSNKRNSYDDDTYSIVVNPQSSQNHSKDFNIYSSPYAATTPVVLKVEDIAFSRRDKNKSNNLEAKLSNSGETTGKLRSPNTSTGQKKKFFGKSKSSENSKARHKSWSGVKSNELMEDDRKSSTIPKTPDGNPIICSGFMFKQGGTGFTPKNWKLRWFVLKEDNFLYYYRSQGETIPLGAVILLNYDVVNALEVNKSFAFKLIKGGARTYYFAVNSEDEKQKWKKHLHDAASSARSQHMSIPECSLKNVSIPAMSITEPECHGYIKKLGDTHKSWKKRYCVLKYGCLFYYENMSDTVAIGVFKLHDYSFHPNETIKFGIEAIPPARKMRTHFFCMESKTECKRWLEALKYSVASAATK